MGTQVVRAGRNPKPKAKRDTKDGEAELKDTRGREKETRHRCSTILEVERLCFLSWSRSSQTLCFSIF